MASKSSKAAPEPPVPGCIVYLGVETETLKPNVVQRVAGPLAAGLVRSGQARMASESEIAAFEAAEAVAGSDKPDDIEAAD